MRYDIHSWLGISKDRSYLVGILMTLPHKKKKKHDCVLGTIGMFLSVGTEILFL